MADPFLDGLRSRSRSSGKSSGGSAGGADPFLSGLRRRGGGSDDGLAGAQDRLDRAVEKADEGGFLDWAKDVAGNGLSAGSKVLGGVMDVLDTSKSAVVATAVELGDVARAIGGKDKMGDRGRITDTGVSLGDIIQNTRDNIGVGDVLETNTVTSDLPLNVKRGLGFLGDVTLDPLTYLTAGANVGARAAGRGGKVAVLSRDDLARRILDLDDEALAAAGASRELADDAIREIAGGTAVTSRRGKTRYVGGTAGRLGREKYDPIRKALGPDVRVGLTFDFGRLGQKTFSPRAAAAAGLATSIPKRAASAGVSWYTRHGGRRAGLDDLLARWEEVPGLRALRRKDPVAAVRMKREVTGLKVDVENFGATWARSFEEVRDRMRETVDKDTLRRALESPDTFDPDDFPEAARALRGFMDQAVAEVERYIGREIPRLKGGYLPHMLTLDMLRMTGGDEAFADLLKRRGLNADSLGGSDLVELEGLNPNSIDAIHDAAKEVFGQDFKQIFMDDPWEIVPKYIQSLQSLMAREGLYGRLERAGLATKVDVDKITESLAKMRKGRKAAESAGRAAERAADRDAQRASKATGEVLRTQQAHASQQALLRRMSHESEQMMTELEVAVRQMVKQGASLEDAQAAAIRRFIAADPSGVGKKVAAIDGHIAALQAQIDELAPDLAAQQAVVDKADDLTRQVGEALGVHTKNEERLYELTEGIEDLQDRIGELRLLKERFAQESSDVIGEAEEAVEVALNRFLDERLKSVRGLVQGGSGNNHERNLSALKKAVRRAVKVGGDPKQVIRQAAQSLDAGIDSWLEDLLRGAAARGDAQAANALQGVDNALTELAGDLYHVADGAGQWVPPTEQDELVTRLAKALGAAEDPAEQATIRGQLAAAQAEQRFSQIGETLNVLRSSTDPRAVEAANELGATIQRAIDVHKRDGGLSAKRRLMRALFGENEMGEARGVLARALDVARDVSVTPKAAPRVIDPERIAQWEAMTGQAWEPVTLYRGEGVKDGQRIYGEKTGRFFTQDPEKAKAFADANDGQVVEVTIDDPWVWQEINMGDKSNLLVPQEVADAAVPVGGITEQGARGMTDDLIERFKAILGVDTELRQAAHEATLKSSVDYTRAKQKAEFYELLHGAAARANVEDMTEAVSGTTKKLDAWIAKRAEAVAIADDVSSGWPSIGLGPERMAEESAALRSILRESKDPMSQEHMALLNRMTELEVALAEAGDPMIRELVKQEQATLLSQIKMERAWGKRSKWEMSEAAHRAEAAVHWDTAKAIGINEAQLDAWLGTWQHEMRRFVRRENLWADPDIVEMVAAAGRIAEPKRAWGLMRLHDEVLARWKAYSLMSPGYHSRNFFSGVWMNGLAGMDNSVTAYTKFGRAWSIYKKQGRKAALAHIKDPEYRRIFEEVIDNEGYLFGRDKVRDYVDTIARASDRGVFGGEAGSLRRKLDPTSMEFKPIDVNFAAAGGVESWLRGPLYIDSRLKGLTPEESLGQVVKYHFDYTALGANEKRFMKRIVPFYTWTRKNLPLQLEMIAKRPGYYAAYGKAQENLEIGTPADAIQPAYYGPFAIRSPFQAGDLVGAPEPEARVYWMPDLPFTSLDELFDPGKLRGQLSPIIKVPWELDRGAQFFSGAPFTGKYVEAPKAFAPLLPVLDGLNGFMNLPKVTKVNGKYYMDDRDSYKVEQALPLLGRLRRLFPSETKYQERAFTSWLSTVGGLSSQTNSSQAQESELLRRVRKIEARLKRANMLDKAVNPEEA